MIRLNQALRESVVSALRGLYTAATLQTLGNLTFGPQQDFDTLTTPGAYPDRVVEYVNALNRRGRGGELIEAVLAEQATNPLPEVAALRDTFHTFLHRDATGLTYNEERFKPLRLAPGAPYLDRRSVRTYLSRRLTAPEEAHSVISLDGRACTGRSYAGKYLAAIGRSLDTFTLIPVDFCGDLPVAENERIEAVHVADTISRHFDALATWRDMYRERREDFKISSFVQSLIAHLRESDRLYLFFFDHLSKVPLSDSVRDLIVYLADKVASPNIDAVVVVSGLVLRPTDQVFGGVKSIVLQPVTRDQVKLFLSRFYAEHFTLETEEDRAQRIETLTELMKLFPRELFADPELTDIAEIGDRCRRATVLLMEAAAASSGTAEPIPTFDFD